MAVGACAAVGVLLIDVCDAQADIDSRRLKGISESAEAVRQRGPLPEIVCFLRKGGMHDGQQRQNDKNKTGVFHNQSFLYGC